MSCVSGTTLARQGPIVESEPMVESAGSGGGAYLNTVVMLQTSLDARAVLAECQRIERDAGRDRSIEHQRWMPRTLDLDIVLFDEQVIDEPGLSVPHPGLRERSFVLEPLAAVWPEARVPPDGATVMELWNSLRLRLAGVHP